MTVDELAALMPVVDGYDYGELTLTGVWKMKDSKDGDPVINGGLADLTTGATRPVVTAAGDPRTGAGWVGEVGVFDAGADTPQVWVDYVNTHHLLLLGGRPAAPDTFTVNRLPGVWQPIGNEIVMTAEAEDGDFAGAWFHDGLIWAVTGLAPMREFAEGLIAEQEATGAEPEQIDVDALEGPLANVILDVPAFQIMHGEPADVLSQLEGAGSCLEHMSMHWVTFPGLEGGDLMDVVMIGFSDSDDCAGGAWIIDDVVANGGTRQDINGVPAVIAPSGTQMIIVSDTGIVVQSFVGKAEDFELLMPVLEHLAATAAETEI